MKPAMKVLSSLDQIRITQDTTVQVKIDGEFQDVFFENGKCWMVNNFGRIRTSQNCLALQELRERLRGKFKSCHLQAEYYAVNQSGKPLPLPKFIHIAKGLNNQEQLRLGIFRLVSLNGKQFNFGHVWEMQEVEQWLTGTKNVHVISYIIPNNKREVKEFWKQAIARGLEM